MAQVVAWKSTHNGGAASADGIAETGQVSRGLRWSLRHETHRRTTELSIPASRPTDHSPAAGAASWSPAPYVRLAGAPSRRRSVARRGRPAARWGCHRPGTGGPKVAIACWAA